MRIRCIGQLSIIQQDIENLHKTIKKQLIYSISLLVLGFVIGTGLTSSYAGLTRFKTPSERQRMIEKHEKQLTLVKLDERLKKVEAEQLKTKADIKKLTIKRR